MPAALTLTGALLAMFAWIFCVGMLTGWKFTFSPLLQGLAKMFLWVRIGVPGHVIHPLAFGAEVLMAIDYGYRHGLAKCIEGTEWAIATLWHACTDWLTQMTEATAQLAEATANVLTHVLTVTIPGKIHALDRKLLKRIGKVAAAAILAEKALRHLLAHRINR